jgi:hypothetical protein|tara:strand:+ start:326 stop:1339 length:1014 start_codon:yes stop_codon:yes gene_type:complete
MHSVIFKNDAVGDLVHSLQAIHNVITSSKKVTIFLSKRSEKYTFLVKNPKVKIKILNYDLKLIEKIKIFYYFINENIEKVYILAPKKYYYYLPLFFKKIKFYAICVNNINNYKRPSSFLRKFLYKYEVNDRSAIFKRDSASSLQSKLTLVSSTNEEIKITPKISENLKKYLPKEYFYFHLRKKRLDELGWGVSELTLLFNEFLKYSKNVVLTKDIETDENTKILKDNFNSFDFKNLKYIDKLKKIIFFDNIDGVDLYNVIRLSKKVVAFHGMVPSLASINKTPILELFHCNINNWDDYRNYRNAFYEFKPNYKGHNFIIPQKDIKKSLKKMKFALIK